MVRIIISIILLLKLCNLSTENIDDYKFTVEGGGKFKETPNEKFLHTLKMRESSGVLDTVNSLGYFGLYQFGEVAMRDLGLNIDHRYFTANIGKYTEEVQDSICIEYCKLNKHYLRRYYCYLGSVINGIEVTESGMIASAHLVGNGGVKKWLRSNGKEVVTDSFGTSIEEYMSTFKNLKLKI